MKGPLVEPEECFNYGGQKYLKKYQKSAFNFQMCEMKTDATIKEHDLPMNSDIFLTCATMLAKTCCFGEYFAVTGRCLGKDKYAFVNNVLHSINKTIYSMCTDPKSLSVFEEHSNVECLLGSGLFVPALFKCFFDDLENIDIKKGLLFHFAQFTELYALPQNEFCGVMIKKLNCALSVFEVCGEKLFGHITALLTKVINTETRCTVISKHRHFQNEINS